MLWGIGSDFTSGWSSNAQAAINAGSTHLMSFNEPDLSSQSNLSPSDAASGFMTYMQPFAGKAKLGSPAITNGGGSMGLTWLGNFFSACSSCTIDYVPIHWYGTSSDDFIAHAEAAYAQTGKPIHVTEFGLTSGSDADISAFLETVMAWMDSTSYIERYAYFMAAEGILVNSAGTGLSDYGATYAS
jgi:O-glycosyl hydrolase